MINAKEAATFSRSSRILSKARGQGGQDRRREVLGEADATGKVGKGAEGSSSPGSETQNIEFPTGEVIYGLLNTKSQLFYVGRTRNMRLRMRNHRKTFGKDIGFRVLQDSFVDTTPADAETSWIQEYASSAESILKNIRFGNKKAAINIRMRGWERAAFQKAADSEDQSLSDWFRRLGRKRAEELQITIKPKSNKRATA